MHYAYATCTLTKVYHSRLRAEAHGDNVLCCRLHLYLDSGHCQCKQKSKDWYLVLHHIYVLPLFGLLSLLTGNRLVLATDIDTTIVEYAVVPIVLAIIVTVRLGSMCEIVT